jgi:hypothetical protein
MRILHVQFHFGLLDWAVTSKSKHPTCLHTHQASRRRHIPGSLELPKVPGRVCKLIQGVVLYFPGCYHDCGMRGKNYDLE